MMKLVKRNVPSNEYNLSQNLEPFSIFLPEQIVWKWVKLDEKLHYIYDKSELILVKL